MAKLEAPKDRFEDCDKKRNDSKPWKSKQWPRPSATTDEQTSVTISFKSSRLSRNLNLTKVAGKSLTHSLSAK